MTVGGFNTQQVKDVVSFVKGKPPSEQPYFGTDAELYLTPEYLPPSQSGPIKMLPASTEARRSFFGTVQTQGRFSELERVYCHQRWFT